MKFGREIVVVEGIKMTEALAKYVGLAKEFKSLNENQDFDDEDYVNRLFRLSTIVGYSEVLAYCEDIPNHYLPLLEILENDLNKLIKKYVDTKHGVLKQ